MKPFATIAQSCLKNGLLMILFLFASGNLARADELAIVKKGKSKYSIRIEENAPKSVMEAARELARLIEVSTGTQLPITSDFKPKGKFIFIGKQNLPNDPEIEDLPHDAFLMKESRGNIWLCGKDEKPASQAGGNLISEEEPYQFYKLSCLKKSLSAGSYNAVIQFAKDYMDARWYMPGEMGEEIPEKASLEIPAGLDRRVEPFFTQRHFDFTDISTNTIKAINGKGDNDPHYNLELYEASLDWGRHLRHSNSLVDGVRQVSYHASGQLGEQLCVSNPEMIKEVAGLELEEIPCSFIIKGYYNYLPNRYYIDAKRDQLESALKKWGEATEHYYFSTFFNAYGKHSFPWSAVDVIDWTISTLKQNNIRGFEIYQGENAKVGQALIGQFGPDTWLTSQLLWDPSQSIEDLLNEWYSGCFGGEIGPFIRGYYELIEDRFAQEVPLFPDFWEGPAQKQLQIDLNVYTDIREECTKLIEMAEMLAAYSTEKIQWRVSQIATTWHYTELTLDTWQAFRNTPSADGEEALEN